MRKLGVVSAGPLANLARLQANLGLRNDALANFERAIAAKPEFAEAQFAAYARERDAGA